MPVKVVKVKGRTIYDVTASRMIDGRRIQRRCRKSKSLTQARDRERELLDEIRNTFEKKNRPTFGEWIEQWLSQAHLSRKNSTVDSYKKTIYKNVPNDVWNVDLTELTSGQLHQVIHNPELQLKPKTRENLLQCIKVILRDAVGEQLISTSPAERIKFKAPEAKLQAWTLSEVNHFLSEAARQNHAWLPIWTVVVFSGVRNGEAYALKWRNVDFENKRLYIVENWTSKDGYHETKSKVNRVVPISTELLGFLKELKLKRGNEEFVLPHFNSWTKGYQAKVLRDFAKTIGLREINFHALRASFVTICLLQNVPPVKVQAMVGHESLTTTMRYVRMVGADLDAATENLGIRIPEVFRENIIPLRKSR